MWSDLLLGEAVERLAHQLEVLAQVARPFGGGQGRQHGRIALLVQEGRGRCIPAGLDPPQRLPPGHAADEVGYDIGRERRGNAGFDLTQDAVVERGPGCCDCSRRMRHVVGDHLVGIDAAVLAHRDAGLVHQVLGQVDRVSGGGEVWCRGRRHAERP